MANITDLQKNTVKTETPTASTPGPEKGKVGQDFYKDLDKYRHRSGCSGTVVISMVTIIILVAAWFLLHKYGFV